MKRIVVLQEAPLHVHVNLEEWDLWQREIAWTPTSGRTLNAMAVCRLGSCRQHGTRFFQRASQNAQSFQRLLTKEQTLNYDNGPYRI